MADQFESDPNPKSETNDAESPTDTNAEDNEIFEAQKTQAETTVADIEKRIIDDVRDEVAPLESARSELATQIISMSDETERNILEDASRKMYDLILEKTSQASQKFDQEKSDYYTSLGDNVEGFFLHDGDAMQKIASRSYPLYKRT